MFVCLGAVKVIRTCIQVFMRMNAKWYGAISFDLHLQIAPVASRPGKPVEVFHLFTSNKQVFNHNPAHKIIRRFGSSPKDTLPVLPHGHLDIIEGDILDADHFAVA